MSKNFSSELAKCMDPALVIVLSEHLSWVAEHPEDFPRSEHISQSEAAWHIASNGFLELENEFANRLTEWREKWQQRFETENVAQIVASGAETIKQITNAKERERQSKNLYLGTVHLMIGDAQKHIVTLNSRAELLQEKVRKTWHKNCPNDSYSKILPSMENAFQNHEETFFSDVKESVPRYAMQEFAATINTKKESGLILNFYLSKVYRYVSKTSINLCKFYSKKWALYARGFSSRQNILPLGMP
ncbi:MAG: hypothetical protein LBC85_01980 [Fibromonadaceae bacterium]|jgi:hypothetical protein|nr:hypothetical protein [Fibromonadaceae bacterium]